VELVYSKERGCLIHFRSAVTSKTGATLGDDAGATLGDAGATLGDAGATLGGAGTTLGAGATLSVAGRGAFSGTTSAGAQYVTSIGAGGSTGVASVDENSAGIVAGICAGVAPVKDEVASIRAGDAARSCCKWLWPP